MIGKFRNLIAHHAVEYINIIIKKPAEFDAFVQCCDEKRAAPGMPQSLGDGRHAQTIGVRFDDRRALSRCAYLGQQPVIGGNRVKVDVQQGRRVRRPILERTLHRGFRGGFRGRFMGIRPRHAGEYNRKNARIDRRSGDRWCRPAHGAAWR